MMYILEAIHWKVLAGLTFLQWYVYASVAATLVRALLGDDPNEERKPIC